MTVWFHVCTIQFICFLLLYEPGNLGIESNIPAQSLNVEDHDDTTGECLSIPSPYFRIAETRLTRPTDIYRQVSRAI